MFFNREDCLRRVLERVREVRPKRLYLAADGPRLDRPGEATACESVRRMAVDLVDWPCELKTLFRDKNLGCGKAVSEAISWFFSHEPEGIILEDDCLVDVSFFDFAAEMLERFRDDERIGVISALNVAGTAVPFNHSYAFSRLVCGCWGWASWRRVWKDYDIDCRLLPELERENELFFARDFHEQWFMTTSLKGIQELGGYNTWDYQLAFANLIQSRLNIVPEVNMVQNLGDSGDGTHIPSRVLHQATHETKRLSFPLRHPPYVMPNERYDAFYKRYVMASPPSWIRRAMKSLAALLLPRALFDRLRKRHRQ